MFFDTKIYYLLSQISSHKISKTTKYVKDVAIVFLEDESGRIELDTTYFVDYLWVTGITLGLKGIANLSGKFYVQEIIEPGIPCPSKIRSVPHRTDSRFVALVSGLNYGKENADCNLARNRLIEFLNGSVHVI